MFKTKSFNLVSEEDLKKSEKSDQYGWLRCLIIPALVGFILTLILVNVDFSGEACEGKTTTQIEDTSTTFTTNPDRTMEFTTVHDVSIDLTENYSELIQNLSESVEMTDPSFQPENRSSDMCTEKGADACNVVCSIIAEEKALNTRLEKQYQKCKRDMDLTLEASTFTKSALGSSFLAGNFTLKSLTFFHCIFGAINNYAFDKPSMHNLQKLIISGPDLKKMNTQTFAGLKALTHFEMTNEEGLTKLDAKGFLSPMAETLTQLIFLQSTVSNNYNPATWLSNADFKRLINVTLNGNRFQGTLDSSSFANLVSVENLRLKNCKISSFADNTFSKVIDTLQYLDLSQNNLQILSAEFLQSPSGINVKVSLSNNNFDCSCVNDGFVEATKNANIIFEQEPICSSPEWHRRKEIRNVKNCCENTNGECPKETTTTEEMTTESSTETTVTTTEEITETTDATTEKSTVTTDATTEKSTVTTDATTEKSTVTTDATTNAPESSEERDQTELVCKSTIDDAEDRVKIKNQNILFTLRTISSTSISVELKAFSEKFQLLYFMANLIEHNKSIDITARETIISNLTASREYVFCAMPSEMHNFSPLNCRSSYTGLDIDNEKMAWLERSDVPLFLSLVIFGLILCLLLGGMIVFCILRCRPTLLKGSKRLFRLNTGSKQVFLSKEHTAMTAEELYEALRAYATPTGNLSNADYLQFFHHSDTSKTIYTNINFSENLPPVQRAPALPPVERNRQLSAQSTTTANDTISLESISEAPDEHEYQSLEEYQEIYNLTREKNVD